MYIFRSEFVLAIFIIHLILLLLALYARTINNKILDYLFLTSACIIIVCITLLRPGFGVDEPSYLDAFIDFKRDSDNFPFDYSFKLLYSLMAFLNIDNLTFNKAMSALYVILLYFTAIGTSKANNKCLYFLMLGFSFTSLDLMFNAYRQAFSFIFIYNAIFFFLNKNNFKGIVFSIISFGFHWSSIILLVLYFASKFIKPRTSYYILLCVFPLAFISMLFPLGIMGIGFHILNVLPLNEAFKIHVLAYLEVNNVASSSFYVLNTFGKIPLAISVLFFYGFILLLYKQISIKVIIPMISLMAIYCLIFMEMAYSFRNYYWLLPFFPIVALSYAESNVNKVNQRIINVALLHIFIALPTFYSSGINSMIFNTNN